MTTLSQRPKSRHKRSEMPEQVYCAYSGTGADLFCRFFDVCRDMAVDFLPIAAVAYNYSSAPIFDLFCLAVGRCNRTGLQRGDDGRIAIHGDFDVHKFEIILIACVKIRLLYSDFFL